MNHKHARILGRFFMGWWVPIFLINLISNKPHANPGKNNAGWRRGAIVGVFPTGHVFGKHEGLPRFSKIVLNDNFDGHKYIETGTIGLGYDRGPISDPAEEDGIRYDDRPPTVIRRLWRFQISELNAAQRQDLLVDGELSLGWPRFRQLMLNQETLQRDG